MTWLCFCFALLCCSLLKTTEGEEEGEEDKQGETVSKTPTLVNQSPVTSHSSLGRLLQHQHCCTAACLTFFFFFSFFFFFFSLALFLLCKQANFDGLSLWRKWANDIVIFRHWSGVIHSIHQQRKRKEGEEERKRKRQKATKQGFVQVKSKREKQRKKKQPLVTERAEQRRAAVHPV